MTTTRLRLSWALEAALPAVALIALFAAIFWQQPRAMSYFGVNLLLNLAVPIIFATIAQMLIIAVNDLDLSIGPFVSLVACIGATLLPTAPVLGVAALAAAVAGYALIGALIEWRKLPSIVVTLGLSFAWLGLAIMLLPTPGGAAPGWLKAAMQVKPPFVPLPIWVAAAAALVAYLLVMRSTFGVLIRGAGGNARSVQRAGWSLLRIRVIVYALAGLFGVVSGLSLLGLTTSGDANIASRYTLISIAAVILGGASFIGGRVSPVGAVLGAMTLTLASSFLTFLRISPDWQIGAQGLILILVLALRALIQQVARTA
ncbi:ABC transporter permease [Labrys wisconsinensis]|uniref:Ribose transport system permease protein n=1 Tax=Labrys wisconsinensis TaxID=425677 RepID=A0ABU0JCE3_9HYPH|nr:ABC transporter permease [Labrys wisconsinensis]MDQ0471954.1 ribose transport system permease protein [Labrys wisconsinensis]